MYNIQTLIWGSKVVCLILIKTNKTFDPEVIYMHQSKMALFVLKPEFNLQK